MNPFVATIIRQGIALGLCIGALAFAVFFAIKVTALRHAMTLSTIPPSLT